MEENNSKVARATLWYTVSNILLQGVSLFTAPIFTRLLSTADYGIASNYNSWQNIVICFTGLSLTTAVLRGKIEFKEKYKEYLSAIQALGMIWCLICCLVMICTLDFWSHFMSLDKLCVIVMMLYLLFSPSLLYEQIDLRFDYKYKENVLISILNTIGVVGLSIGMILLKPEQRYLGRIVGITFPTIFFGACFSLIIFIKGRRFIDFSYWKYALKLSLPMIPHGLAMIVLGQIDRIMILRYTGESAAGIYSFGYSYGVLLFVVTNAVNDAVQPQMYAMLEDRKENEMESFSYRLMMLGVMLSILIIGVGPEALMILGTADYFDARWVIAPVVLGTMMQYIYQFYGVVEVYSKKTVYMAIGSCMAAVVNYVLNWIFIPRFGWIAAAYTTLISYSLLMFFHFIMARVAYRKIVYSLMPILKICVIMLGIGMLLNFLYNVHFLIRYGTLFGITGFMGYFLRDEIKMILEKVLKKR